MMYCTWQAKVFVKSNANPSITSASTPTDLDPQLYGSLNTLESLQKTDANLSAEPVAQDTFTYFLQRFGHHYLYMYCKNDKVLIIRGSG